VVGDSSAAELHFSDGVCVAFLEHADSGFEMAFFEYAGEESLSQFIRDLLERLSGGGSVRVYAGKRLVPLLEKAGMEVMEL